MTPEQARAHTTTIQHLRERCNAELLHWALTENEGTTFAIWREPKS